MRKGENIRKRKDNRWEARFYNETSQKYVSVYAKSYSEVKQKVSDARTSHQKNMKLNHLTVEVAVMMWLSGIKDTRKQSTYAKYHDIVHNHIIPEIGKVKLNKLNQDMVDCFIKNKYLNGRIDKRGGLSPKTIKDIINVLKQALQKNNLYFIYEIPNYKRKELSILTNEEYYLFLNHLLFNTDSEKLGLLYVTT